MSILLVSGKAMRFYNEYVTQTSIVRGTKSITNASNTLIEKLSYSAKDCAQKQYDELLDVTTTWNNSTISEEELEYYFRIGFFNELVDLIGDNHSDITSYLDSLIKDTDINNVSIVDFKDTCLKCQKDNKDQVISIQLSDVKIKYSDPIIGEREDIFSYDISIPDVIFYTGNEELFDYCLVAGKGIYITGATSSIMGNVYAGGHSIDEVRPSDKIYGEIGTYGGLNILSTQLGIKADKIAADGDINLSGSFVIFDGENHELNCYAKQLNDIDSFAKETLYSMNGVFYPTTKNNEKVLNDFHHIKSDIEEASSRLDEIEIYYDTANEEGFVGPYRVLMSTSDIEIKDDFTGIVLTPCNVIVNNDINVEGLIICGDRIYIRGNNNIVSNKEVLRKIIEYETTEGYGIKAVNFLGGIVYSGITHPDYYVIPYR